LSKGFEFSFVIAHCQGGNGSIEGILRSGSTLEQGFWLVGKKALQPGSSTDGAK
jgi:hypothetical protein